MGYDKAKKAALWAAYPLHAYYTAPNASKERAYSADPSLGKTEQMVGGVGAPYNKGHQVPNADRKVSNLANKQISYYSNMTPQLATFNSGAWGTLENRVRGWMCADTLYVERDVILTGQRVRRPTTAATRAPYRHIITRYCCAPSRAHGTTRNHACGRRTAMHRILVRTNHRQGPDTGRLCGIRGGDRSQMRVRILRQRAERSEKRLLPGGVGPFGQLTPSRKGEAAPAQQRPLFFCIPATTGAIRPHSSRGAEAGTDNSAARGQKRGFHWKQPDKTARRSNRGKSPRERQRGERPRFHRHQPDQADR